MLLSCYSKIPPVLRARGESVHDLGLPSTRWPHRGRLPRVFLQWWHLLALPARVLHQGLPIATVTILIHTFIWLPKEMRDQEREVLLGLGIMICRNGKIMPIIGVSLCEKQLMWPCGWSVGSWYDGKILMWFPTWWHCVKLMVSVTMLDRDNTQSNLRALNDQTN